MPGGGPCTVLTTAAQIQAVTGFAPTLNEPTVLGRFLYVADDENCGCVISIDTATGIPELFVSSAQITDATGNMVADPEGGLALDVKENLYIGDDGGDEEPNILRSNPNGTFVSVFISETEIRNFYAPIAPGFDPELDGSMCIQPGVPGIPTLSEWGMLAMAAVLGILGLAFTMRRRVLKA